MSTIPIPSPATAPSAAARAVPRSDLRRFLLVLALIAAAGLALRVTYTLTAKAEQPLVGDAIYYAGQASAIAAGRWFDAPYRPGNPAADHPPLNALVLTPAAFFFPGNPLPMRLTLCMFGAATIVLTGLLGRAVARKQRGGGGGSTADRVGWAAATLAALYAGLWINDGVLMAESLAAACIAATLLAVYGLLDRPSAWRAAAVGALVGACTLARGELALLGPLVAAPAAALADPGSWRRRIGLVVACGAASAAVIAPWSIYNLTRFERFTLLSTNEGHVVAGANCPATYYGGGLGFWSMECAFFDPDAPVGDQSVLQAWYRERGEQYRRENLARLPVVMAARVARVWSVWQVEGMTWLNTGEGREPWASKLALWSFWILSPVAAAGALLARRRRITIWPLAMQPVLVTGVAAWYYGIVRLRLPAEITLVVLAALALVLLRDRTSAASANGSSIAPD